MQKKIPVRQCVACREKKEKRELARIVKTPEGQVVYDATGKQSGRGAYICKSTACLDKAIKIRALNRALECEVSVDSLDRLREQLLKEGENGK